MHFHLKYFEYLRREGAGTRLFSYLFSGEVGGRRGGCILQGKKIYHLLNLLLESAADLGKISNHLRAAYYRKFLVFQFLEPQLRWIYNARSCEFVLLLHRTYVRTRVYVSSQSGRISGTLRSAKTIKEDEFFSF